MVGVRDEKRPFDRLGANEVVPGVSLFEQLRPFLLQHRAELIAEHREESGEIEFGMDIGVLHVETAGDALPHRLHGDVHYVAFPNMTGNESYRERVCR